MGLALGRLAAILTLLCGAPAFGEAVMARVVGPDEAALWTGVGSLRVAGRHSCTAVLISPSEAITAAHCVVDHQSGKRVVPALYRLVLGQRTDGFAAVRGVRATAFLPGFVNNQSAIGADTLASDVALLALDSPVLATEATPVPLDDWPNPLSALVDIVGYERGGSLNATIREACRAIDTVAGVTTLGCDAIVGISGAPVMLRLGVGGAPRLVASVSSRGDAGAFVVAIAPHLAELRSLLK
jgi:protease YdgD